MKEVRWRERERQTRGKFFRHEQLDEEVPFHTSMYAEIHWLRIHMYTQGIHPPASSSSPFSSPSILGTNAIPPSVVSPLAIKIKHSMSAISIIIGSTSSVVRAPHLRRSTRSIVILGTLNVPIALRERLLLSSLSSLSLMKCMSPHPHDVRGGFLHHGSHRTSV